MTRDSRDGHRGVRIGEAQNPGPPRTRARARMEEEAEAVLTGLEAAINTSMIHQTMKPSRPRGGMMSACVQRLVEVQTFVTCGHVQGTLKAMLPSFQHCWI